jgi:hypothetical protein
MNLKAHEKERSPNEWIKKLNKKKKSTNFLSLALISQLSFNLVVLFIRLAKFTLRFPINSFNVPLFITSSHSTIFWNFTVMYTILMEHVILYSKIWKDSQNRQKGVILVMSDPRWKNCYWNIRRRPNVLIIVTDGTFSFLGSRIVLYLLLTYV